MSTRGLVARADSGGLGHLAWEVARHVRFDRILVVVMGDLARGVEDVTRYDGLGEVRTIRYGQRRAVGADAADWLADCDATYTAEADYDLPLAAACAAHGHRLVVHAMPELFDSSAWPDDVEVWLPTMWRYAEVHATHRRTVHQPVPIAVDRFVFDPARYDAPRLLHVGAPAMLDRSGTELLAAALPYVTVPCTIVHVHAPGLRDVGCVHVEHRRPPRDYWRLYDDVSALIAPRRYGGLSLVLQEAAAAGLGAVTLDRAPENEWPFTTVVPVERERAARMKGGRVPRAEARVQALAAAIDRIAGSEGLRRSLGTAARGWALARSWDRLADDFAARLDG